MLEHKLPELPYATNALEPHISERTLQFHHGKHHAKYVKTTNALIAGTEFEDMPLEDIIRKADGKLYNQAAQVWNHTFYWNSMHPGGGGAPNGEIEQRIADAFGGYEDFAEQFKTAGADQFGSGWAWLVLDDDTLKVRSTSDADNPIGDGQVPLLTMDVWEHAYYLDYQNRRPDYIGAFLEHLVNWEFVNENLSMGQVRPMEVRAV